MRDSPPTPGPDAAATRMPLGPAMLLSAASALVSFDVTAVVVALPSIGRSLDIGLAGLAWVVDAYSLAFAGLLLAAGSVADARGRRWALQAGNGLFAVASLACALAWDGPSIWAARAVQGAGGAFLITGGLALLSVHYPAAADRARAFALAGVVSGVSMAVGPTIGGWLTTLAGWRWIFILNLPVCALVAVAVPGMLAESKGSPPARSDPLGVVLLTSVLAAGVAGILSVGSARLRLAWFTATVILVLVALVRHRMRAGASSHVGLLRNPTALGMCAVLLSLSFGYWAVLVYLPPFLQTALSMTPEEAGMAMLAGTLPMVALPIFGGRLLPRLGLAAFFGLGVAILSLGDCIIALGAAGDRWRATLMYLGMAVAGCGAALVNSQGSGAIVAAAPPGLAGSASALATVVRQGGFALGVALLAAVLGGETGPARYPLLFAAAAIPPGVVAVLCALQVLSRQVRLHAPTTRKTGGPP